MWLKKIVRKGLNDVEKYRYGKPVAELQRELGLERVVRLSSNENPWPLPEAVCEALESSLKDVQRYPDPGAFQLRRFIAGQWGVSPAEVILGSGTEGLLHNLLHTIIDPGDQIVFPVPTYPLYRLAGIAAAAECVPVETGPDGGWSVNELVAACTERTKAVIICNPNNPTGKMLPRNELIQFASELEGMGILLVVDEAYAEYIDDPAYLSGIRLFHQIGRVVITRTFSKIYGLAALRVGYAISPKSIADAYDKIHPVFEVSRIAQRAALAALGEAEYIRTIRLRTIEERNRLLKELLKIGVHVENTCANFVLVRHRAAERIYELLLREGVIVRRGSDLGFSGFLRVTVGTPEENDTFLEAMEKVLNKVEE
ncbi:MAG: histidinol-phosphate transaminase [Thermovirgaceae bacterium]